MFKVNLNCDLGESFGAYTIGLDSEVIPLISSANIACGYHAGDPCVMRKTVELCKSNSVSIGAHPGFPDLMGFGRRNINASSREVEDYVTYQIGALDAFCRSNGARLTHVKPHGALYNMAGKDEKLAKAIVSAVYNYDKSIVLLALSGSKMIEQAELAGLKAAREVFADRAYESDGSLVARTKPGAMITNEDEAVSRVVKMITQGKVTAIDSSEIDIQADSVCVHGDGAKALEFVQKLNNAFKENNIEVVPIPELFD